ncbi:hypothetical protein BKA58DRAFT_454088 [Alternaria rosae]|uniref:uncharacterized protein n=1 Tax=Alternaria rosae TaxID=1187941 RepID=UPI001E8EBAEF|nr:uncharacterized protein BKA58DRAFT_454088 [Alternaria rosae]KAH6875208.1 hypothetical protein BKA58DRAFT_454088 [Alternaria rosae]
MAEHTKLITIDPNGDTLLKLKDIRWELPEWIDEATRFAPPVDVAEPVLEDTAAQVADESAQRKHPEEVHFLVSSRQLRLVSTYFDTMFKRNFAESVADSTDGKYHIWATEWNPEALERLMNIAHARSTGLRDHVNLDELAEMVLIVDYYDMHEAPYTHVKRCFTRIGNGIRSLASNNTLGSDKNWKSTGSKQAIKAIVDQLDSLIQRLGKGEECCYFTCRASLLGSLILLKQSGGLSSAVGGTISPPYYGTSLQEACAAVQAMTVKKHTSGIYGGTDSAYTPIGACQRCDFGGLFDRIMKKVDEDLAYKLDPGPSKVVNSSK